MPGLHSQKSPSGAKRWHNCSGSIAITESLPPEMRSGSGYASKLGTVSHFLLETCLSGQRSPKTFVDRLLQIRDAETEQEHVVMLKPSAKLPRKGEERGNTFVVDLDMVANVDIAYDYVERRCEELGVSMNNLQLERRTNPVPDRDDTSGTADVTIDAWPICLSVVDFKNGRIVVEHDDNPQLLAYLAGRAHDEGWDYCEYEITVIQPNGRHSEGKARTATVTKERLLAFVEEHRAAAERVDAAAETFPGWVRMPDKDHAERAVLKGGEDDFGQTWSDVNLKGGEWCDFCDAALVCPAFKEHKQALARAEFGVGGEVPDLKTFRVTAAAHAREIVENAGPYLSALRMAWSFLRAESLAGRKSDFLKFVRKISKRVLVTTDAEGNAILPDMLADRIVAAGFIGANERARLFKPETLITGPQIEKLVDSKKRAAFSATFLNKPLGGLKLVLATDPGEPVPYSVGDDFVQSNEEESDE